MADHRTAAPTPFKGRDIIEPTIRDFSVVSDLRHQVGECPTWDERNGRLLWTSIIDGQIHAFTLATGEKRVWQFDGTVGSFGLCRSGRLVVAVKSEVVLFDPENGSHAPLARVDHVVPQMRLNDGKVGPDGAFWVGSMDDSLVKEPVGRLYRVEPSGRVDIVADGIKVANGLAWDRAGTTMYFADSRGPWVDRWQFDPATGEATGRSRFLAPDEAMGRPDGAACDSDDCYWSASPSAGRINKFSTSGELLEWTPAPNVRPTMPCFGGPGLKTMFVTSLMQGQSSEPRDTHPLCGTVLAAEIAAPGLPTHRFAD